MGNLDAYSFKKKKKIDLILRFLKNHYKFKLELM